MARYINSYSTAADVQSAIDGGTLNKPYVAYIENDDVIDWNSVVPAKEMPLTFEIISGGTVYWRAYNNETRTIQYSLNGGEWTSITSTTNGVEINVNAGDVVRFRGNNGTYGNLVGSGNRSSFANSTPVFKIKGNIASLLNSNNFSEISAVTVGYNFNGMFENCTGLISVDNSLSYLTKLVYGCYYHMFQGCTSLTTAPELPAAILAKYCCYEMFKNCRNLNYIKCLATDISASSCTTRWVDGVASKGTFVTPASTDWTKVYYGIPSGWTRVDA